MQVVILELVLFIPEAASLKDKRQVVKRIIERIKSRCNASVAETAFQDAWQRAGVGIAMVGSSRTALERQVDLVRKIVYGTYEAEVTDFNVEYI